jgi:hypothetical protein
VAAVQHWRLSGLYPGYIPAPAEPAGGDRLIWLPGRSPVPDAAQLGVLRGYGSEREARGAGTTLCGVMTQIRQATRLDGTREQAGAQSPELMTAPDLSDAPGG